MATALNSQNIFLVGPMGAGKTTIGRMLARLLGKEFFDSDIEIEKRAGAELAWIFDIEGEDGFRQRELKIIDELTASSGIVLATGGGAVLEGANRQVLGARGLVVYLKVSVDEQMGRTVRDERRPSLRGGDKREILEGLSEIATQHYEEIADLTFATEGQSAKVVAKIIYDRLLQELNK